VIGEVKEITWSLRTQETYKVNIIVWHLRLAALWLVSCHSCMWKCPEVKEFVDCKEIKVSWLGKLAKSLFIFPFFSFLIYNYKVERGKVSCDFVTTSQRCDGGSQMVTSRVTVTVGHMMRVTWGPWESKRIATVVKCISSREMSENSIEFSLSNSEQRGSWLNSGHRTLDADTKG